jgi:hypothetical protein
MRLVFPSHQFDEAVAAVCHGSASEAQMRALNELLRSDSPARDEYVLRLELHSRLASEPDLFISTNAAKPGAVRSAGLQPAGSQISNPQPPGSSGVAGPLESWPNAIRRYGRLETRATAPAGRGRRRFVRWVVALAACVTLLAAGWWGSRLSHPSDRKGATSKAVAMLDRVVDAQWDQRDEVPRSGAPLEPGWLRLKSGLAQVVFYSGARVVIEGPTELRLISPSEAFCPSGRLIAEVPPQATGFRVSTPRMNVTDLGTSFGLEAKERQTELHVFKGRVECQTGAQTAKRTLSAGAGAVAEGAGPARLISASPTSFASLFDLQLKSSDAEVLRHEQWRAASSRLDEEPSLLMHFDFEQADPSDWRLPNASKRKDAASDATVVGCQWTEGRWPDKRALEFRSGSDRVRLSVPGEYESLTLAAWVRVQGLDRQINSLFMSDGFKAGTVHWSIRHDGVLGLTAIGSEPGRYQICPSPPVLTLDQFGLWVHLAVVIDGGAKEVAHYLNGVSVSEQALRISPPFLVGAAELGNWNAQGFPKGDPFMIRNFSGAMDEFCLFGRALSTEEIHALFSVGKPQPDPLRPGRN